MSYVNMMSNVRWSEADHVSQVEAQLRSQVTHVREHVLDRRLISVFSKALALLLPPAPTDGSADTFSEVRSVLVGLSSHFTPLTMAAMVELGTAAAQMVAIDALAAEARSDSVRLNRALDYEEDRAALAALAPTPVADPVTGIVPEDTLTTDQRAAVEAQRAQLQSQMAAATQDTLDLVAQRDAFKGIAPTQGVA